MIKQLKEISVKSEKKMKTSEADYQRFATKLHRLNAVANSNCNKDDFDIDKMEGESENALKVLQATGGLQEMLTAQMLSIHRLQQISMALAHSLESLSSTQYYLNAGIKLANCFTQQANLLSRLQGNGVQKIIVERVEVHPGGQAVVGNINGESAKK